MAPTPEVTRLVRNRSSRRGVKPRGIVIHTTEGHDRPGLSDLQGLGSWFDNPAASASSHVGNDQEGNDARYVPDGEKAWTCSTFNSQTLNIEQIGFAKFAESVWIASRRDQLENTAAWIAYWSQEWGIPVRRGKTLGPVVTTPGVMTHAQLGALGGGHHDPGAGYPLDWVLNRARQLGGAEEMGRKERRWRRQRAVARGRLGRILDGRRELREKGLDNTGRYRWTTVQFEQTRARIEKLSKLIEREEKKR